MSRALIFNYESLSAFHACEADKRVDLGVLYYRSV